VPKQVSVECCVGDILLGGKAGAMGQQLADRRGRQAGIGRRTDAGDGSAVAGDGVVSGF
jgi:hypothetical protein